VGKQMNFGALALMGLGAVGAVAGTLQLQGRNTFLNPDGTTPVFNTVTQNKDISIEKSSDGYFRVTALVNGKPSNFIVDTGANFVAIPEAEARKIGINVAIIDFNQTADSPAGKVLAGQVVLRSVTLGGIRKTDIPAYVIKGDMPFSLLGMSYLSLFSNVSIQDSRLVLTP